MRTALASILVLSLATIACEPQRRELVINWTFAGGKTCADVSVATIEVDIAGEVLNPNQFACTENAVLVTGVDLGRFLVGEYDVQITGFDKSSNPTYQLAQTIRVSSAQNPNVIALDIPVFAAQSGQGSLTLLWTFDGKSCAAAGVSTVNVSVDGTPITDEYNNANIPCNEGGTDGVTIGPLSAGTHAVSMTASGSSHTDYALALSANIADGNDTALSPNLVSHSTNPATATAELSWSFAGMSCADAKVDSVHVLVDGTDTGAVACSTGGTDGASVAGISAGTHVVSIEAIRGTGASTQLVYATAGTGTSASFLSGTTTHLLVSAAASSPGVGGAKLTLSFPNGGPDCTSTTGSGTVVTYALTSPAGVAQAAATVVCGGANGNSTIFICTPGAPGCGAGNAGLVAGVWSITASAAGYSASGPFAVPNDELGISSVAFTADAP